MATKQEQTAIDLKASLEDIGSRFPKLSRDELFVLWFLRAYITESEQKAAEAVSGGAGDKGIDAVFVDDAARAVFIVQGKFRDKISATTEKRADVIALTEVGHRISEADNSLFQTFIVKTDGHVAEQLRQARQKVLKNAYRVWLYFATTGKVSDSTRKEAESLAKKAPCELTLDVIDGRRIIPMVRDYLDGVAPPIPALDLEMEKSPYVNVNGVSQRYDNQNNIESWVFSMRGDAVAAMFEYAGVRLFARNIRGYLGGKTPVNEGMIATLNSEPDRFIYYNNGVTILCDEATKKSRKGKDILVVSNPQVINGQQTTRTLARRPDLAAKASVLVKVIQVTRGEATDGFEGLVSRIVQGTNWQNAIKQSDLMANDRIQIDLERSLRKLGYAYLRKRITKGEAKVLAGGKHYRFVRKETFAQAVAACDLEPFIARSASEKLFEEEYYSKVFPNSDPHFYLPRYLLLHEVLYVARRHAPYREPKWLVLNYVWSQLASKIQSIKGARAFTRMCESQDDNLVVPLNAAIGRVFAAALKFFRSNQGTGDDRVEVANFFKSTRCKAKAFSDFWQQDATFEKQLSKAVAAIENFEC
jgi:hypothetical protein